MLTQTSSWLAGTDDLADAAVYVISVAADLAGMHPQTLRQYDRLGLVSPSRTRGRGRRYSGRDIARLREIQRLSQEEGINLAGISEILRLHNRLDALEKENAQLRLLLDKIQERQNRIWAADSTGVAHSFQRGHRPRRDGESKELVHLNRSRSVVVFQPYPSSQFGRINR